MRYYQLNIPGHDRSGFTLIELSIVLVIIGLIVGGILVGRDLIRAAEIRSVTTEIESYKTALNTFRLKYNCIPGDCPNATSFFGADTCPNGGVSGTCDGNGNGEIEFNYSYETWRAWQQLSLAELIAGSYTGIAGPSAFGPQIYQQVPGVNSPVSKYPSGVYTLIAYSQYTDINHEIGYDDLPDARLQVILLGAFVPNAYANAPGVSAHDAYLIDSKIDDGRPGTGSVRSGYVTTPGGGSYTKTPPYYCASTPLAATAEYLRTETAVCVMGFILWPL